MPTRSIKPTRSKISSADINASKVDLLLIINSNPAYNAPADLEFADCSRVIRFSYGFTSEFTRTKPPSFASGISTRHTNSKAGAMPALTTAPSALSSR